MRVIGVGLCNVFLSYVGGNEKNEYIGLLSKKLFRSIKGQYCVCSYLIIMTSCRCRHSSRRCCGSSSCCHSIVSLCYISVTQRFYEFISWILLIADYFIPAFPACSHYPFKLVIICTKNGGSGQKCIMQFIPLSCRPYNFVRFFFILL